MRRPNHARGIDPNVFNLHCPGTWTYLNEIVNVSLNQLYKLLRSHGIYGSDIDSNIFVGNFGSDSISHHVKIGNWSGGQVKTYRADHIGSQPGWRGIGCRYGSE